MAYTPQAGQRITAGNVGSITNGAWLPFTPTWTAATTNPTIGDGSLTGQYYLSGFTVFVNITLLWGAATVGGTGLWTIGGLPIAAAYDCTVAISLRDNSSGNNYAGAMDIRAGTNSSIRIGGPTGSCSATVPFTWTNPDRIQITGCYPAAA